MEIALPGNPYHELRQLALETTPSHLDLELPAGEEIVYGMVMDWDLGKGVATLTSFLNGEANLLVSSGGGVVGGEQLAVREEAIACVKTAQSCVSRAQPADWFPLPDHDCVRFYFLTNRRIYAVEEPVSKFEDFTSAWVELFDAANRVISQLRLQSGDD